MSFNEVIEGTPYAIICGKNTGGEIIPMLVDNDGKISIVTSFKGWYATPAALRSAYPTASDGDYAIVGSTDTVWVWDTGSNDWVDSGGAGLVTSVFTRTGAVTAQANDYTWGQIDKSTSSIADITTRDHSDLTLDDGTNPHSTTKLDVGLGNVTNNAQYYPGGTDVAIADGGTGQGTQQAAIDALTNVAGATNEHVLTKDTGTGNAIFKAVGAASDVKAGVDAAATADYVGAASNDGFLRVDSSLDYADGGDFVTLSLDATLKSNYDAAYTHVSNNGSDHSFIDQDVTSASAPTFTGTNFTGLPASAISSGTLVHERGGLEADISAYAGLVHITGGATSAKTIGIADDNILEVDGSPNDNEIARFTANGIEGLTYAETMAALSAQAGAAFSWNSQNLSAIGTIGCGTITIADGSSLNLQENITFTGATTENQIKMPDNLADALSVQEGVNKYITFVTTDNSESINLLKNTTLGEVSLKLDEALSADGKWSGITCDGVLGDTIAYGDLVYLANADDRWELADADAAASAGDVMLGICLDGGGDGDATEILLYGFVREDDWDFTSGGDSLYVSTTAGDMTATAPSGSSDVVRVVGHAHDNADTIFFNPSGTWVEVA